MDTELAATSREQEGTCQKTVCWPPPVLEQTECTKPVFLLGTDCSGVFQFYLFNACYDGLFHVPS